MTYTGIYPSSINVLERDVRRTWIWARPGGIEIRPIPQHPMMYYTPMMEGMMAKHKTVIVMDSQYVYKGLTGRMHQWQAAQWVLRCRAVSHVDVWQAVLRALHNTRATIKWLWVPSHAGVEGNERVNALADLGRARSPLLRVTQSGEVSSPLVPLCTRPTLRRSIRTSLKGLRVSRTHISFLTPTYRISHPSGKGKNLFLQT